VSKLWPLECSQDFSKIWPSDLLFDPTSPMFQLDPVIIKTNILSKFEEDRVKTVSTVVLTRFFQRLDLVTYFLTQPRPSSNENLISSRQTFWASLRKIGSKLCPRSANKIFSKIWPSDLLFDPTLPMFEVDPDIIKTNILRKFEKQWVKTVAASLLTRKLLTHHGQRMVDIQVSQKLTLSKLGWAKNKDNKRRVFVKHYLCPLSTCLV